MRAADLLMYFLTLGVIITSAEGITNYATFIKEIHNEYGTAGIIMASTANYQSFERITVSHVISRAMSNKGIITVLVNFTQLKERIMFYHRRIVRPLVVIFVARMIGVRQFEKLTLQINMSYPIWLILFTGDANGEACEFCMNPRGNRFNLKFNSEMLVLCCDNVLIEEWWSQRENTTSTMPRGVWNANDTITWLTDESLYSRRNVIDRPEFRISIVKGSGFIWIRDNRPGGFLGEILVELCKSMNFTISAYLQEDSFGSWNAETSTWSGVVGKLSMGEADLGISEFTMTKERQEAVDFTLPFALARCRLYYKKPSGSGVQWNAYLRAFETDIWMAIVVLLVVTPILLTIVRVQLNTPSVCSLVLENYLSIWGIFCQQGLSEFPQNTSLRIIYLSVFVSALVVSAAYSASLISFLTTSSTDLPFTNMDGFVKDGTYKLIVFKNSSDFDLFKLSSEPTMKKMMSLMKPPETLPESLEAGFTQVCNEKVAFFTNEALKKALTIYLPCEIVHAETGRIDTLAMMMPFDSEYKGLINYHIQRFRDNGMLDRLRQKHFTKINSPESGHDPVELWGIAPVLSVLAGGILITLIIFFIERINYPFNNKLPTKPGRHESIRKRTNVTPSVKFLLPPTQKFF